MMEKAEEILRKGLGGVCDEDRYCNKGTDTSDCLAPKGTYAMMEKAEEILRKACQDVLKPFYEETKSASKFSEDYKVVEEPSEPLKNVGDVVERVRSFYENQ